ncbi:MAG: hypothetical protein QGG36_03820, partial [Pirellulaceae bacterium]|nr:hypothetical protein [Pirellulaceae bacterium]
RSVLRIESLSPAAPSAPGKSGYLTPDGALLHALVFRDAQFGFVGQSGFILTIEPSGEWSRQPFVNKTIRKADRSGKLTPADLKSLERVLRANDLNSLPAAIGKREGANPHTFQITFGSLKSELILRAGGKLPDVTTASTPLQRFANIATAIQHRAEKQGGR